MKDLLKHLYEHLITKGKYNTLMIKYEIAIQDRANVETNYEIKKKQFEIKQKVWEKALKEQEEQIIELKRRKIRNDSNSKKEQQNNS